MTMKYILYCRKSTESEDRQVMSIEAQEREMLDIAKRKELSVVTILKESRSAKDEGRPLFDEMIRLLNTGKADAILTWKLDRLARNFRDGGVIIDMLQKGAIKEIGTHDQTCFPSDNVLMLAVEFGMANQYIRDLSANVKRGNREKLARGEWPNHAPFGYINDKATKTVIVDEERKSYIIRMYELYATGTHSYKEISDILFVEGMRTRTGKKVFKSQIQRVIMNPFYHGVMVRDGKSYIGKHEPLISRTLFDKAQAVTQQKTRPRPKTLFFPLRGFLTCESCGCSLTASLKKGHHYYYCTNGKQICDEHKSYMREKYLYEKVADVLSEIHFDEGLVEIMYEAAKEKAQTDDSYAETVVKNLSKGLEMTKRKESRLLDSYLSEQIPQALYEAKMREIANEKTGIERQITETREKNPDRVSTLEPIKDIFLSSSRATKEFLGADDTKKQLILEKLLWNISLQDKNIVSYQFKSPYNILARTPKNCSISDLLPD
jgi:site-specific DNA recombinase